VSYIFIGYANGAPAGYIYAQILRREETALRYAWERLYIHHISVSQAYQRQGIGQALMQAVIRVAKEHSISTIALDVWSFNTKARVFCAAQGFSVYNETMWLPLSGQE
jgi:GNAT superfamily N-acetyltransferase